MELNWKSDVDFGKFAISRKAFFLDDFFPLRLRSSVNYQEVT
jgi:hypothetical protein